MQDHILCSYSKTETHVNMPKTFYDFHSQKSYMDLDHTIKVINLGPQSTIKTFSVESGDPDELHMYGPRTGITKTIESTDVDELHINRQSSIITRASEESDADELYTMRVTGTTETSTIETSDPDRFF